MISPGGPKRQGYGLLYQDPARTVDPTCARRYCNSHLPDTLFSVRAPRVLL